MVQAFIPEQEVKEQIIEFFITEGKLDGKKPSKLKKNNLRLKDNLLLVIYRKTRRKTYELYLESSILNLYDALGIKAKVSLKQGDDSYFSRSVKKQSRARS